MQNFNRFASKLSMNLIQRKILFGKTLVLHLSTRWKQQRKNSLVELGALNVTSAAKHFPNCDTVFGDCGLVPWGAGFRIAFQYGPDVKLDGIRQPTCPAAMLLPIGMQLAFLNLLTAGPCAWSENLVVEYVNKRRA